MKTPRYNPSIDRAVDQKREQVVAMNTFLVELSSSLSKSWNMYSPFVCLPYCF